MLVAIPWRDEADAIRMANDSHYGLAAYIWTHDIGSGLRAAHDRIGLGPSKPRTWPIARTLLWCYKQSGIGREFSLEGMLDSFTQRKNVAVNLNTPRRQ